MRWWGYQRSNGIPDFSCNALKTLWVFTWTLSRFAGYVLWRPIRLEFFETKSTNEKPRHVSLGHGRSPESVSRGQKYDDTFHIFHAPWSYFIDCAKTSWFDSVSGNFLFISRDPSLTSFSQSQAESVSNISSQLGETLFGKQCLQNTMTPTGNPISISYITRTIELFDILLQIIWCPHISDPSWLEYLWLLVMHSDQWEANLSSDWPLRGQDGELLQQRASPNHRVQWPHSSAFS